ncbi:MAG TPA: pantoate--beta-alanine ligase [Desulfobulbus sp.]|nr:pantoate--beta-alanine ligase [Desulfobulbus sp.]
MDILHTPAEMTSWSRDQALAGSRIALVPTMGYFHEGHLRLMRMAARHADRVVVSLFVNPTQFGPGEDLDRYPRDIERDTRLARREGVDLLFVPDAAAMYPDGFQTVVSVDGLSRFLCGASRPGHFAGVTTVVCKLFHIVRPDCAVFGEKDFQQLAVIRRMVADLNMGIEILGHPIVREPDGLAMSSRNTYLDETLRPSALSLYGAIRLARELAASGVVSEPELRRRVREYIESFPETDIDYVAFVNGQSLETADPVDRATVLALAVRVGGRVRLIDNGRLFVDDDH